VIVPGSQDSQRSGDATELPARRGMRRISSWTHENSSNVATQRPLNDYLLSIEGISGVDTERVVTNQLLFQLSYAGSY
jgi:hypothetical protein